MDNGVEKFLSAADRDSNNVDGRTISDQELEHVLTAAVQLYARRTEATEFYPPPISKNCVTPTEILITVSEMIRIVDVNMFDLSMWYQRVR